MALSAYVIGHRSVLGGGLWMLATVASFALLRASKSSGGGPPPPRVALAQLLVQSVALGFLTTRDFGLDPFSYALSLLRVPVTSLGVFSWALGAVCLVATYCLLVARKVRLLFLLGARYVFYAHWDYRFLPLIWGSSTADFYLAKKISETSDPKRRKLWLLGTVALNLGVLGFFKYFNFGVDSMATALSAFGLNPPEIALRIALP